MKTISIKNENLVAYVGFHKIALYINNKNHYLVVRPDKVDKFPNSIHFLADFRKTKLNNQDYIEITIEWSKMNCYYGDTTSFIEHIKDYFQSNIIMNIKSEKDKEYLKFISLEYNPPMYDTNGQIVNGFLVESNNIKKVIISNIRGLG